MLKKYAVLLKSSTKLIKCFCPKCEKMHKARMEWKGHGVPRVYCEDCRRSVEGMGPVFQYETNISKSREKGKGGAK